MNKLIDENPYEILDISPDSSKQHIKKVFAKKNRARIDGKLRRKIRQAYDTLRSPEKRLLVDALTPNFVSNDQGNEVIADFQTQNSDLQNWQQYVDPAVIWQDDWRNLCAVTLQHSLAPTADIEQLQEASTALDGLEQFFKEWLT